jgi:hypothetical protein
MNLTDRIEREMGYGLAKFGRYNTTHEAIAVIREEYLEMEREVFHGTVEKAVEEAIQLAAVAMRFAYEYGEVDRDG